MVNSQLQEDLNPCLKTGQSNEVGAQQPEITPDLNAVYSTLLTQIKFMPIVLCNKNNFPHQRAIFYGANQIKPPEAYGKKSILQQNLEKYGIHHV
jgi:alanine-alpha-ketoisovalerate/valine-pyruvate aminotransferase